jgi:hypothetical protein
MDQWDEWRSYLQNDKICASDSMATLVYQKAINVVSHVVRREV